MAKPITVPGSIQVGAIHYTVLSSAQDDYQLSAGGRWAEVDFCTQTIRVLSSLHPAQKRIALLHEIVHCILKPVGGLQGLNPNMLEETFCELLGDGLTGLIKHNPMLIDWIEGDC